MTEKTLKHELYKHGSYLHSLKESGSSFVNIDEEIQKLEELFQMASKKDHQPVFAVGEYYYSYYVSESFFKVTGFRENFVKIKEYNKTLEKVSETEFKLGSPFGNEAASATAEQIAQFKRAEHFASKGRKLDEFRVGDKVMIRDYVVFIGNVYIDLCEKKRMNASDEHRGFVVPEADFCNVTLIQTAEELQEVD